MRNVWILLVWSVCLWGCGSGSGRNGTAGGDTLYRARYASGFELFRDGASSVLKIKDPWQGAEGVEKTVYLARGGQRPPEGFSGEVVGVPVKRAVCMSSSYVAFLDALDCDSVICGVSGAGYICSPELRKRIETGEAADVGADNTLNYELLSELRPDVVFAYGISGENAVMAAKLKELGIPVVYIGEYVENSPLGRAEWVRVLGEFTDRGTEAETLFDSISHEYERVRALTENTSSRPTAMLNAPWRDSWFVPGDRSYFVRLIGDAGGTYACAGVDSDQSRPISLETAFVAALASDFWLNPGSASTMDELLTLNPNFTTVPAVTNGRVFNNNARTTPDGGSDFWESGVIRPHIVLKDMIRIFHPELLPDHELYYFRQLK